MSTTAPEAPGAVSCVSEISRWVMPRDRAPGYKLPCGDGQQPWSALLRSSKETLTRSLGVILTAMARKPETHYAKGPGGDIAYQVVGDGPIDLVIVPGWISHVDLLGQTPGGANSSQSSRRSLASFSTTSSERVRPIPSLKCPPWRAVPTNCMPCCPERSSARPGHGGHRHKPV